jgi:hypothetical protein
MTPVMGWTGLIERWDDLADALDSLSAGVFKLVSLKHP